MNYNKESGYGRGAVNAFPPVTPHGKTYIVGANTLTNRYIVQDLYKHDVDGNLRIYATLATAIAAIVAARPVLTAAVAVTVSTAADTLTTTSPHLYNNGDKVYLSGTTAPTGTTLGLTYYVVGATALTFQVSLQRGGTAIDLTGTGTAVKVNFISGIGSTIYILPGHNENVSSATALALNVSGIKIKGLGSDEDRPTFYLDTATTTTISVTAPEVTLENVIIDGTGFDAIASIFTVNAPGFQLKGCKIIGANATNQAAIALTTNALAHRMILDGNRFIGTTDAGATNGLQLVGGDDIQIKNNYFLGAYTTSLGPINNITTACLRILIENNVLINATASSTKVIVLVSGTTGIIRGNELGILSGTAPITGAGVYWMRNYYAASVGSIGILE